jgi:DNA-binding NtrC family response regulator
MVMEQAWANVSHFRRKTDRIPPDLRDAMKIAGAAARPANDGAAGFIGESPAFANVKRLIDKLAQCDAPVLIQGETGTGKELAARAIHYTGTRRNAPFVPVNCGAIPETLVESELFGHARGAFTDAREARSGVIAQAEHGTLFLDEIETLGMRGQVALLRFLQNMEYRTVGGSTQHRANVRIIAASNVNLTEQVRQGLFRQDLLFRLNVLALEMPPLRARGDDVILLTVAFADRYCQRYGLVRLQLSPDIEHRLRSYAWPGNVRELENMVHRDLLLSEGQLLQLNVPGACAVAAMEGTLEDLTEGIAAAQSAINFREAKARAVAEFERAYLSALMSRTSGNVSLAARLCGQERSRLNKMVLKYGLGKSRLGSDSPAA